MAAMMKPMEQSADWEYPATAGALAAPIEEEAALPTVIVTEEQVQKQLVQWSNEFDTDPESILRENNITSTGDIKPGQKLTIPPKKTRGLTRGIAPETEEDPLVGSLLEGVGSGGGPGGGISELTSREILPGDAAPVVEEVAEPVTEIKPVSLEGKKQIKDLVSDTFKLDGEEIFIGPEGTSSVLDQDVVTKTTSGEGTRTDIDTGPDLESVPVETTKQIAETPVVKPEEELVEKLKEEPKQELTTIKKLNEELDNLKKLTQEAAVSAKDGIADKDTKTVFEQVTKELTDMGLIQTDKKYWEEIAKPIDAEIKAYNEKILAIAEEKYKPKFEGANKWLAVLGAALGAYGSAMTGTPNFALNILESSIERDQEMFLASKEMRTKSLERQRLDVITRRGELLQSAQNEANRLFQVAGLKMQAASIDLNKQQIQDELAEKIRNNKANYALEVKKITIAFLSDEATKEQALAVDQQKRYIKGIPLVDENGEPYLAQGYLARTVKEAEKLREARNDVGDIRDILDQMEPLYDEIGIYGPQVLSDKAVELEQLYQQLLQKMKNINKMGANFTVSEQAMLKAQIPGANWSDKMGIAKVKLKGMRRRLISGWKNVMDTHSTGRAIAPVKKTQKKTTGLKSTGIKVPVK